MSKRIIYGGNFINKGAEALTLSAVDILRKKFPNDTPVLLNLFPNKFGKEKDAYDFKIVNMHVRTLFRLQYPILKLILKKSPKSDDEKLIKSLFDNANGFYDINGYGISSHNQQIIWTLATIFPAFWANKKNIPVVLLPQSLGPFNFKGWKKIFIKPLVNRYLKIPKTIFIREKENKKEVENIRKNRVFHSNDLVILNPLNNKNREIKNSIALIPNRQLTNFLSTEKLSSLYAKIIKKVNLKGYEIDLFAHSTDDFNLCENIYNKVENKNKITYHKNDLSIKETEELISKMRGVITSRYHGLVHSLRAGKPSMSIGWASKYSSLLKAVAQEEFYFDMSKNDKVDGIFLILDNWLENGLKNSNIIIDKIHQIQSESRLTDYL